MADGLENYEIYAVTGSDYCYRESNVLGNKLGIRGGKQLRRVETDISAARQTEIINHICTTHRYLLGDVYSFAGHFRREDIAKGETRFLNYAEIQQAIVKLLDQLSKENYRKVLSGKIA